MCFLEQKPVLAPFFTDTFRPPPGAASSTFRLEHFNIENVKLLGGE